jgi:hypothetical protein
MNFMLFKYFHRLKFVLASSGRNSRPAEKKKEPDQTLLVSSSCFTPRKNKELLLFNENDHDNDASVSQEEWRRCLSQRR